MIKSQSRASSFIAGKDVKDSNSVQLCNVPLSNLLMLLCWVLMAQAS